MRLGVASKRSMVPLYARLSTMRLRTIIASPLSSSESFTARRSRCDDRHDPHEKSIAAADLPARSRDGARAAAARRHAAVDDRAGRLAGESGPAAATRLRLYADGVRHRPLDSRIER